MGAPWHLSQENVLSQITTSQLTLPVGDIALELESTSLTAAQQLELGLSLDQKKVLIVPRSANAVSLAEAVDSGGLTHILIREDDGSLSGIVDVEWAKGQARTHLKREIDSFHDLVQAVFAGKSSLLSNEWLTTTKYGRPDLVVCHQPGHHGHWAQHDPCGQP